MRLRSILILAAVFALELVASSTSSAADRDEIANLLTDLDRVRHELRVNSGTSQERDRNAARQARTKLSSLIPKLRGLIKVGTHILDYPGLISAGDVTYSGIEQAKIPGIRPQSTGSYELYLGRSPRREGIGITDFRVVFDDRGLITAVEDVDWKH